MDIFKKCYQDGGFFSELRALDDFYYSYPILESAPNAYVKWRGKDLLMWSVNDYLGLAGHPEVKEVAVKTIEEWGSSGPMGARILTGNTDHHLAFEAALAKFSDKPAALLTNFGYLGVIGTITALAERGDTVIIDNLSHSCIVDGAVLAQHKSGQRIRPFKHNNAADLERNLEFVKNEGKGGALIVTEGVFGMRGELGILPEIVELKNKYGARLMIDDAHGFGIMGDTGKGTGEHLGVHPDVDLYFSTFTKSCACIGGFFSGPNEVLDYVRYNSKQVLTSDSPPMVLVKSAHKALEIIEREPQRREKSWHIGELLKTGLRNLSFDLGPAQSPITPVYLKTNDLEMPRKIGYGLIRLKPGVDVQAFKQVVARSLDDDLRVLTTQELYDEQVKWSAKNFALVPVFGTGLVIGIIVGIIICYQILYIEISNKIRQFATLKALGFTVPYLFKIVLYQALVLSIGGWLLGIAEASIVYSIVTDHTGILIALTSARTVYVLLLTVLMCSVASILAVYKLKSIDPTELFS